MAQLILIRGLPGSGKSTLAQKYVDNLGYAHFEADQYFLDESGNYCFNPRLLERAHNWCQLAVEHSLRQKKDTIVANCFVRNFQITPYETIAIRQKADFCILQTNGKFGSVHNVPQQTIDRMRQKWEVLNGYFSVYLRYPLFP